MRFLRTFLRGLAKSWEFIRRDKKAMAGAIILFILLLISAFPSWFTPDNPTAYAYTPGIGLSWAHPLGTDSFGRDVFSQLMAGTRQSVMIALVVGFFCTILSVAIGVTAAYSGGVIDDVLSLGTDVILVIPTFPLVIVIAAYLKGASFWTVVFVLVITGWSYGARQLRVQASRVGTSFAWNYFRR